MVYTSVSPGAIHFQLTGYKSLIVEFEWSDPLRSIEHAILAASKLSSGNYLPAISIPIDMLHRTRHMQWKLEPCLFRSCLWWVVKLLKPTSKIHLVSLYPNALEIANGSPSKRDRPFQRIRLFGRLNQKEVPSPGPGE